MEMIHTALKGRTVHGVLQASLEAQSGMCVECVWIFHNGLVSVDRYSCAGELL